MKENELRSCPLSENTIAEFMDFVYDELSDDTTNDRANRIIDEAIEMAEYPQDQESNEYRYISPAWLDAIAGGLTTGAVKHPGETWRQIPAGEHLARALRHINLYRMGDRSEPHIVNASMRLMMAFDTTRIEKGRNDK